jgi:hypothetical protein
MRDSVNAMTEILIVKISFVSSSYHFQVERSVSAVIIYPGYEETKFVVEGGRRKVKYQTGNQEFHREFEG